MLVKAGKEDDVVLQSRYRLLAIRRHKPVVTTRMSFRFTLDKYASRGKRRCIWPFTLSSNHFHFMPYRFHFMTEHTQHRDRSRLFPVWRSFVRALEKGWQGMPMVKSSTGERVSRGKSSMLRLKIWAAFVLLSYWRFFGLRAG